MAHHSTEHQTGPDVSELIKTIAKRKNISEEQFRKQKTEERKKNPRIINWRALFAPGTKTHELFLQQKISPLLAPCLQILPFIANCQNPNRHFPVSQAFQRSLLRASKGRFKEEYYKELEAELSEEPEPLPRLQKEEAAETNLSCEEARSFFAHCALSSGAISLKSKIGTEDELHDLLSKLAAYGDFLTFGLVHTPYGSLAVDRALLECDPNEETLETGNGESWNSPALGKTLDCVAPRLWGGLYAAYLNCALMTKLGRRLHKKGKKNIRKAQCEEVGKLLAVHWGIVSASRAALGRGGLRQKVRAKIESFREAEKNRPELEEGEDELERTTVDQDFAWFLAAEEEEKEHD